MAFKRRIVGAFIKGMSVGNHRTVGKNMGMLVKCFGINLAGENYHQKQRKTPKDYFIFLNFQKHRSIINKRVIKIIHLFCFRR